MRKSLLPLLAVLSLTAFTFTSCDKDDAPEITEPRYKVHVIGFEDAVLPTEGYIVEEGYGYSEKQLRFPQYFTDWGEGVTSWSGFAVSNKTNKEDASAITNGFSVYDNGGYGGSSQFAVLYYSEYDGPAECSFTDGLEYEIEHVYLNNATVAALTVLDGSTITNSPPFSVENEDWFKLTITGYDKSGTKTDAVDVYLADYRDENSFLMSEWTKVDLSSLGAVNTLGFTFTSTDNDPDWGIKTPTYVCIDNIAYREYVTE